MTQPPRRPRLRLIAVSRRFPLTLRGFRVTPRSLVLVAVVCALSVPGATGAQQAPPPRMRREIKGLDFRKDGVWRRQARAVRALRARLLSRRSFGALKDRKSTRLNSSHGYISYAVFCLKKKKKKQKE